MAESVEVVARRAPDSRTNPTVETDALPADGSIERAASASHGMPLFRRLGGFFVTVYSLCR